MVPGTAAITARKHPISDRFGGTGRAKFDRKKSELARRFFGLFAAARLSSQRGRGILFRLAVLSHAGAVELNFLSAPCLL